VIVVPKGAIKPTIDVFRFNAKKVERLDTCEPDALPDVRDDDDTLTWVNVIGLGDRNVLEQVADHFNLHDLAMEDVAKTHQRPKLEEYSDHLYLVLRLPSREQELEREQISLFVGKNFVLTWQEHVGDCFAPVRERIESPKRKIRSRGSDYLAYALIDAIVDAYFPVMSVYADNLDRIEDSLTDTGAGASNPIAQLHHLRTDIRLLRRDAWSHREVLRTLISYEGDLLTDETRLHLRDVLDHTLHLVELTESSRDSCGDLHDLYMSSVSMRMNEVMQVLTIIATIFIPLSFIAGLYGMNFDSATSPWNMPETHWYLGYPFALSLMTLVAAIMLLYFRRRGWLGGGEQPSASPAKGTNP